MIRVLHIVTDMGRGGLETMLMNYYRAIDRTKIQFDFLTHRNCRADYDDEIESLGGIIYHFPRLNPFSRLYKKKLGDFFDTHPEYSIIHVHQDCLSGVILKVAKEHGIQNRIAHSHNSNQTKNLKYPLKIYFRRIIVPNSTDLFACSKEAGEWMFRGASFSVLNNAIDAEKYAFNEKERNIIRQQFSLTEKDFVIGHVGRFSPQKNHNYLIDIFEKVRRDTPSKLILVGEGELRKDIEKKVSKLGLSKDVIFTGVRSDVEKVMQAFDVFLFPSNFEGLPVTMVEAQAAGLPCIISDKVPIECKITNLVYQIPLSEKTDLWAKEVMKHRDTERKNTLKEIVEAGYDIKDNTKKLERYYCGMCKQKERYE